MLRTVSTGDIGSAAIVVGLLGALVSGHGILVAGLLVFVGVGLRVEAALRAGIGQRRNDAQPSTDSAESQRDST